MIINIMPLIDKSDYPYPYRTISGTIDIQSEQVTASTINAVNSQGFGGMPTFTKLTGSGTYVSPANAVYHIVEAIGGGGGAGCCLTISQVAGGGGGGGYIKQLFPTGSYTYSVGTGGAGATSLDTDGANGTDTTFGTLTAPFGGQGFYGGGSGFGNGGVGGVPTDSPGTITLIEGGGGTSGQSSNTGGAGGGTFYAGNTRGLYNPSILENGPNGNFPGGGGGAGVRRGTGGNGADGTIIVTTYF